MKPIIFLWSAFCILLAAQTATAATLVSGDFEGDNSAWKIVGDPGSGITCTNANVISGNCSGLLNAGGAPRGVGLEQDVSGFVVGQSYKVDVDVSNFAATFGSATANDFGIFAVQASGTASATASSNSLVLGNNEFSVGSFGLTFFAKQGTVKLQFLSQLVTDRSFIIDNVTLSGASKPPSVVPLPAALPMLLAGIGGLGFLGRRKKKAA